MTFHSMHYEVQGDGEPVVFLNGVMMTTASWALQTRSLARHFRCVLHDFRGQLRNPAPGPYRMIEHVDDLVALLDHLEIKDAHLVGTSYGGEVGMMFAARYPDRVKSLSVIACVSHVGEELRRKVQTWAEVARSSPERLYDVSAVDNFSPRFLEEHPEVAFAGTERLRSYPPEFFRNFADLCDAFLALDIRDELPRIAAPTLVIAGSLDTLKPLAYSEEIAELIPNAELRVLDGGHALVIENAADVNSLIGARVSSPARSLSQHRG